jgi:hypothetical protein
MSSQELGNYGIGVTEAIIDLIAVYERKATGNTENDHLRTLSRGGRYKRSDATK